MTKATDPNRISDTIVLDYPIKDGTGNTVKTLTMRRAKVKDNREIRKSASDHADELEVALFARLCNLTIEDMEKVDMADYAKLQDRFLVMGDFLDHVQAAHEDLEIMKKASR